MKLLAKPFPLVTVMIFAVLSALPWGGDENLRSILPMMPLAVVHFWSARRPNLMPAVGVLFLGVLVDLLSQGPIGFYALLALMTGLMTTQLAEMSIFDTRLGRLLLAIIVFGCVEFFAWGLASLYFHTNQPLKPYVSTFMSLSIIYPFAALILGAADNLLSPRPQPSMFSGRG